MFILPVLGATLNVTFVNVYLDFTTTYTAVQNNQLDIIYTNPSIFSCLQTQNGVNAIASIQSLRPTAVAPYTPTPQSAFGGNFFALSSRTVRLRRADRELCRHALTHPRPARSPNRI